MSVNTRFYHLNVSWENLLACCGIHLLRQNEGEEKQTLATTKTVRPSRELLLPLMLSKTKLEEEDCTPSPWRLGRRQRPRPTGSQAHPHATIAQIQKEMASSFRCVFLKKKNAEHLPPMVFCDACRHGNEAGQVFTLQEEGDRQWVSVHTEPPWVGRRGPPLHRLLPLFRKRSSLGSKVYSLHFSRDKLAG